MNRKHSLMEIVSREGRKLVEDKANGTWDTYYGAPPEEYGGLGYESMGRFGGDREFTLQRFTKTYNDLFLSEFDDESVRQRYEKDSSSMWETNLVSAACVARLMGFNPEEVKRAAQRAFDKAYNSTRKAIIAKEFDLKQLSETTDRAFEEETDAGKHVYSYLIAKEFGLSAEKMQDSAKRAIDELVENDKHLRAAFIGYESGLDNPKTREAAKKAYEREISKGFEIENHEDSWRRSGARSNYARAAWLGVTYGFDEDKVLELAEKAYGDKIDERATLTDFLEKSGSLRGIPQEMVEHCLYNDGGTLKVNKLAHVLSLPYHLRKMKEDGLTHLVFSAVSSVPYVFALKELDRLMFPDGERIKFLMYDPHLHRGESIQSVLGNSTESAETQLNRFADYFHGRTNVKVGVFDECVSSFGQNGFNSRGTVNSIQEKLEDILPTDSIVGRYGTEASFPIAQKDKDGNYTIKVTSTEHGDEGKGDLLTEEGNLLRRGGPGCDSRNSVWWHLDSDKNMIFYEQGEQKKLLPHKGVWRHTGANGLKKIDAYKKMAKMAYEHWLNNPEGVWNPDINKARANL